MKKEFLDSVIIQEEKDLRGFFDQIFNLGIIAELVEYKKEKTKDSSLYFHLKSHCLPLCKGFFKELDELCDKTRRNLGLDVNDITFYLANDPEFNCQCLKRVKSSEPSVVIINSGLLEKITLDELAFVLGHEIGHILFDHFIITEIFKTVYPNREKLPPLLNKLYSLWCNLSELSADRIGLLASKNFETSIRALIKLASGGHLKFHDLPLDNVLSLIETLYEELKNLRVSDISDHPPVPIRIKALKFFYDSHLWKYLESNESAYFDEQLEKNLREITSVLRKRPFTEEEYYELLFLASAGIFLMTVDKEIDEREHIYIANLLSKYIYWPIGFIEGINKENLNNSLEISSSYIRENCPWKIKELLTMLFNILIRDQKLKEAEVFAFKIIANKYLKISEYEINEIMLESITERYIPFY
ncbi:MAG: M48 family metallopeptidase [Candidatus Aminicenantes bacterium]|nr:M48 family metallopeptidase [Candidatus Aminicenantes bacterium]